MKIDYSELYSLLKGTSLENWAEELPDRIAFGLRYERYGQMPEWEEALAKLPNIDATPPACQSTASDEGWSRNAGLEREKGSRV